jgi:Uma2 family endonuclease
MATSVAISLDQYLRTSYRPDCDYIDGEVQERNLGETEHSDLQTRLVELLLTPESKLYVRATTEPRVQVKETRFRILDVCVRRISDPKEQFIRRAPLLCIEVLSPEDRMSRIMERVRDYLEMGVPEVWVFDTSKRSVLLFAGSTMVEQTQGALKVPETPLILSLADIFQVLDEY